MSWIPKKTAGTAAATATATATAVAPRVAPVSGRSHAHSLEMPIVMSVRRLPAPVYATLMEITAAGCKIRSLVLLDRGNECEFDLGMSGGTPITICGRVHHRRNAPTGARFEYELSFDMMPEAQVDLLARQIRELEIRAAASRTMQASIDALPTTDRNRRGSYRALTSFSVEYRREGAARFDEGRVGDLSATGIRMNCFETIAIGTMLELRVTLPSSVLDVYPEETLAIDMSSGTPRRIGRPDMRRPFDSMVLRGRVVTRFQPVRDREVYGVAFLEIDGYQREEIARFTHALQLSKMRNG